jgi:hypothetical protein
MRYSKWAQNNKHRLGINTDETDKKENLEMNDDARSAAVRGLIDKAKTNRGEQTDAERQRADAVAYLAGKQPAQKPLRPGVRELLNGGQ